MFKLQKYLLTAYMILCPIAFKIGGGGIREFQEFFFQTFVMLFVVALSNNIWITSFFGLNCLLYLVNGADVGTTYTINLFFSIALMIASKSYFRKVAFDRHAYYLLVVCGLSLLWAVFQFFGVDPVFVYSDGLGGARLGNTFNDPVGLFVLKAHAGIFYALCVPILARWRWWAGLALFPFIWMMQSSGAMIAGGVSYLFFLYFRHKQVFKWFACLAVVGGLVFMLKDFRFDSDMFNSRFAVWHSTTRFALQRPIGWGPDSFRNLTKYKNFYFSGDQDRNHWIRYMNPDGSATAKYYHPIVPKSITPDRDLNPTDWNMWDHPHNEYLKILFEQGILGCIFLFFFLNDLWVRFKESQKTRELVLLASCIIVYLISSTTQFPFHVARLGALFPIILGAFYARTDRFRPTSLGS